MVLLVFWACDEKEGFNYTAGNQIYFENPDSTTYSFAVQASTVLVDTVYIPIHIHGLPADVDRVIDIRIDESLTTAPRGEKEEGAIFNVQPTILPAKTWTTNLEVFVYRQQALKGKEFEVYFVIEPGKEFLGDMGKEYLTFKLKINNILTPPDNWEEYIEAYFGVYGPVKYQFIIDKLHRYSFPESGPDAVTKGQMAYYRDKLRTELMKYEKEYGPLMEGDVKVEF
jgi:hypothetical protein